ncbi:MAG: MEDS domain-containing protein [Desulfobacterales bacterium]|jgi:signal transduction histidine kinase|nr:MEDS domain-containing protein [Desulfobacterales bacterium]
MGSSEATAIRPPAELELHLWKLQTGDHVCALFSSDRDYRSLLSAFIRHGLERREKVVAAVAGLSPGEVRSDLAATGVAVSFYLKEGQLAVHDTRPFCRADGRFDPGRVIDLIHRAADGLARDGHAGLRLSIEMPDPGQVVPYEAALNGLLPGSRCLALCPYDRRRFPTEALLAVLDSHPLAAIGAGIYENVYFTPPSQDLSHAEPDALKLENRLEHLVARRSSENQIRTLTRKLMQSQEDERQMISRELHDRVGQDLSSLRIEMEALRELPLPPVELRERIAGLSARLDRSIFAVRDLAYDLKPPGLEIGMAQAMSMLCGDFSEKTGIKVEFMAAGIEKLQPGFDFQINLYRMIQEALNNIHKHAHAQRAAVKLTAVHPHVLLRIEDDGCGFDVEKRAREIDSEKRMGLRSLKERADLLGGVMVVTSRVGHGTRILIKLPCKEG